MEAVKAGLTAVLLPTKPLKGVLCKSKPTKQQHTKRCAMQVQTHHKNKPQKMCIASPNPPKNKRKEVCYVSPNLHTQKHKKNNQKNNQTKQTKKQRGMPRKSKPKCCRGRAGKVRSLEMRFSPALLPA
jgi:hypothetical protein